MLLYFFLPETDGKRWTGHYHWKRITLPPLPNENLVVTSISTNGASWPIAVFQIPTYKSFLPVKSDDDKFFSSMKVNGSEGRTTRRGFATNVYYPVKRCLYLRGTVRNYADVYPAGTLLGGIGSFMFFPVDLSDDPNSCTSFHWVRDHLWIKWRIFSSTSMMLWAI